jgi:hypothetical protein
MTRLQGLRIELRVQGQILDYAVHPDYKAWVREWRTVNKVEVRHSLRHMQRCRIFGEAPALGRSPCGSPVCSDSGPLRALWRMEAGESLSITWPGLLNLRAGGIP